MVLEDSKTKAKFFLSEDQSYYVQRLLCQMDIIDKPEELFSVASVIKVNECITVSALLSRQLQSNTIFEFKDSRKVEPFLLSGAKPPSFCQPISLSNMELLATLSDFLNGSSDGIRIWSE